MPSRRSGSRRRRARSDGVPAAAASLDRARSRSGRGSRGSHSRRPARRSRARGRPCGRRARGQPAAGRRCRSRPSRSRGPARPARRPRGRGCGRATLRDESGSRWAWRRWHESWSATRMGSGWRAARGGVSASSSPTSRTFAANVCARSSPRSQPSSFRCDPQPDALTTTRSTSSKASTRRCANAFPSSSLPACTESAPQQPCGGATTSNPSAARTRAVAAFTSGKTALCTHPVRRPTLARRVPTAGVSVGTSPVPRQRGAISTSGRSRFGIGAARPSGASRSAARMRPGYGRTRKRSPRTSRSPADRSTSCSTVARVLSMRRS